MIYMNNIASSDDFFIKDGKFEFIPELIGKAHQACFLKYDNLIRSNPNKKVAIMSGIPGSGKSFHAERLAREGYIVVDNTNLTTWEISPYYLSAESRGMSVTIFRVQCPQLVAYSRQTHNVPHAMHYKMYQNFVKHDILPWWNVQNIENRNI